MRRAKQRYVRATRLALLTIAGVLACWPKTGSCTVCKTTPDVKASYEQASDIFVGEVIRSNRFGSSYVLKVIRVFKGHPGNQVPVLSGYSDEYLLRQGQKYLVYGSRVSDSAPLRISACSRTRILSDARKDINYLSARLHNSGTQ